MLFNKLKKKCLDNEVLKDISEYCQSLEYDWNDYRSDHYDHYNKWWVQESEKEFYLDRCFDDGLSEEVEELVLKELGY